jgi:hypothetical protein
MQRNMFTRRFGNLMVLRQNREDATEEDWKAFLGFLSDHHHELEQIRLLVYTDGGIPTAAQRRKLADTLGNKQMLVAAVSDNIKVRFSGATIALFQKNYRQFTTAEIGRAFDHLKLTPSEARQVSETLRELEASLYPKAK